MSKSIQNVELDWQSSACTVVERIQKLYELEEWTDCKFLVGIEEPRTEFPCHKIILAVSSPVFEALFYGSLAHKNNKPVVLPDIEPDHFRLFIKYLYTDELSLPNVSSAQGILYAAKKYLIPHLAQKCLNYLESNLKTNTLLETLHVAEVLKENRLKQSCLELICRSNHEDWWNSSMIQKGALSPSTLGQLLDIMSGPVNEMQYLSMLLMWAENICHSMGIEPSSENKRMLLDEYDLMRHVRFLRFTVDELHQIRSLNILSKDEYSQLEMCILRLHSSFNVINRQGLPLVPKGFNPVYKPRNQSTSSEQIYMRATVSNRTNWLNGGFVKCHFESDFRILLTGFTMYTRLPHANNFPYKNSNFYEENIYVIVKGPNGKIIQAFYYKNSKTQYYSTVKINFKEPFWVEPKSEYYLTAELGVGQYPSYDLSEVVVKDQDRIKFQETYVLCDSLYPDWYPDPPSPSGVIAALCGKKYKPQAASSSK